MNYRRLSEEGSEVSVTETIVKEAESFEETERYAHCMMKEFGAEEYVVKGMKKCRFTDVFFCDGGGDCRWYEIRVNFILVDEKTGKEKKSPWTCLVEAESLEKAVGSIKYITGGYMTDYVTESVKSMNIQMVVEQ